MAEDTYISVFSGAGGIDLGLRIVKPDARCICYVEIGIEAAEVLASRIEEGSLEDAPIWSDARTFPGQLYGGRVAGIVAGFPCPDYSVAGKRAGILGKHGQLWDDLAAIIRDVGPDWVLLENVSGILVSHGSGAGEGTLPAGLWFVLGDLAGLGFDAEWISIRASDIGASHGRRRWFCLARRRAIRELGNAAGDNERRQSESAMHGTGIESRGSGRSVAHASRDERPGSHGEAGRGRGIRGTGNAVGVPQCTRRTEAGSRRVLDAGGEPEPGCGELEHAAGARFAGRENARTDSGDAGKNGSGSSELSRGREPLGNPHFTGLEGRIERALCAGEWAARPPGDCELADTRCERDERRGEPGELGSAAGLPEGKEDQRERSGYAIGDSLPLFAPGPGATGLWARLLVRFPWMRPALSQAEAESDLRLMADGMADLVGDARTDALRAVGNGCVPQQVAAALIILARRFER